MNGAKMQDIQVSQFSYWIISPCLTSPSLEVSTNKDTVHIHQKKRGFNYRAACCCSLYMSLVKWLISEQGGVTRSYWFWASKSIHQLDVPGNFGKKEASAMSDPAAVEAGVGMDWNGQINIGSQSLFYCKYMYIPEHCFASLPMCYVLCAMSRCLHYICVANNLYKWIPPEKWSTLLCQNLLLSWADCTPCPKTIQAVVWPSMSQFRDDVTLIIILL